MNPQISKCGTSGLNLINTKLNSNNEIKELPLINWLKMQGKQDKMFIDIGSGTGSYTLILHDLFSSVIAFEPDRAKYYSMCGNLALNINGDINIKTYNIAISNFNNEDKILYTYNDDFKSISHHLGNVMKREPVLSRSLDSYMYSDVGFIRVAVNCHEENVLLGMLITLERSDWPTILFDLKVTQHNIFIGRLAEYRQKLFELLEKINYKIITIRGCPNHILAEKNR